MEGVIVPLVQQLGLGGIAGAIVGFASKKVAKIIAVLLGVLFILLQYLAYKYAIDINWGEISGAAAPHLADGGKGVAASVWQILTHNIPFGAAFTAGFLLGFRKG